MVIQIWAVWNTEAMYIYICMFSSHIHINSNNNSWIRIRTFNPNSPIKVTGKLFIDLVSFGWCLNTSLHAWISWHIMDSRDGHHYVTAGIIKTWKDEVNYWNSCRKSTGQSGKDPASSFYLCSHCSWW